jgi:hypothetical protein
MGNRRFSGRWGNDYVGKSREWKLMAMSSYLFNYNIKNINVKAH